ncbi:MAG TPA: nucleotidyltransferase [Sulfuricurvum kujiense]|uniref:Nucleotidyltransferase n=1 Tax=Sulfuricurvum kujiense TaxID=148813 RepID=A0A2D3WMG0_9BACT|nr:nucleotidyltransferase substrate binding protein [Sulfuricurvum kujiense]DAB38299.1 MAG TPA: nucleotidyltransferase [Sulfuricurvum kujiense]
MALVLTNFLKAIEALERSLQADADASILSLSNDIRESIRAGVIQNFEVCYEQSWKMMKRWIENHIGSSYVDGVTRRELFRVAAENRLIADVELWMGFHSSRNETSHTYDQATANEVFADAKPFLVEVKSLFDAIQSRND